MGRVVKVLAGLWSGCEDCGGWVLSDALCLPPCHNRLIHFSHTLWKFAYFFLMYTLTLMM